jgi:hypothetical protein
MRDEFDADPPPRDVPFPTVVKIAGYIWIVFGCLILLSGLLNLMMAGAAARGAGGPPPTCAGGLGILFGIMFLHVGRQSVYGTARDTLGNGIGSIGIGLLNAGVGVPVLLGGAAIGGKAALIGLIAGGISVAAGAGLLIAGVLALVGRSDYKAWRRAQRERRERAGRG